MNEIFGYKFKDKKLFETAFTHSSFSKNNYERLEFLGDSILDFVVGDYFFHQTSEAEGQLTRLRAQFVSENFLARVFDRSKINEKVILGKSYKGKISKSIKADIVEAIIGAIYLDSDYENVKKFVISFLNLGNYKTMKNRDYKSQLQVFVQSKKKKVKYRLISKSGLSHNPCFKVSAFIDNEVVGVGEASSKQEAEQEAAFCALKKINN